MKRIHLSEDRFKILNEIIDSYGEEVDTNRFEAGTDNPCFYDPKEGEWHEASWNGSYAFPFGYWKDGDGYYVFSVGDAWTTHENACGKVAKSFVEGCYKESIVDAASTFIDNLSELVETIKKYGYTYDEDEGTYTSEDGSDVIDINDWIYDNCDVLPENIVRSVTMDSLRDGEYPYEDDVTEMVMDGVFDGYDFYFRDGIDQALQQFTGYDFNSYFQDGYGMGRVWPEEYLITFYSSEQPDPSTFMKIMCDLEANESTDLTYEDLEDFYIIFHDFDNDYVVTGCTVYDYLRGNYGPNDDEEEGEERERTYGDGNTQFIPHLASSEEKQKMGIYKDFQANRDAKWAPRLKGFNGNMAAYRAARYPYSDSRIIKGNVLSENKKRYLISNQDLRHMIRETINDLLLTESQESKSISAAKKLVMQKFGYDEQQADKFIRVDLRQDLPSLRTPEGGKFILGVTRMYCDGELRDANTIGRVNTTLKYVASDAHINEYDRNLNGMSAQDLIDRFAKNIEMDLENDRNEVGAMELNGNSDYKFVRIDSFEQAKEYSDYTSWCVTQHNNMFNSYTNNGINQFYFCLRDGFEQVPQERGEGCPLDEYGLSMLAVLVNENGGLVHCTCRWNHNNGGNDNIMTTKEISEVIGMNFYDVFKPNTKWKDTVELAMQRLANGEEPEEVFDRCYDFKEGFAVVQLNDRMNLINKNGEIISPNQWFDLCSNFADGFSIVESNRKFNFLNGNGELLSKQWFDNYRPFSEGFALIQLNRKWNYLDQNGNILLDKWYNDCYDFHEGRAMVNFNGAWNYIDQNGKFISDMWFDDCGFFDDGIAIVWLSGYDYRRCNFIDQNGKLLSKQWYNGCGRFKDGFAKVKVGRQWNYIDKENNVLSDLWFDDCYDFKEGFAIVGLKGKFNYIDQNGKLLSPKKWFDWCGSFNKDGLAEVELDDVRMVIGKNGL